MGGTGTNKQDVSTYMRTEFPYLPNNWLPNIKFWQNKKYNYPVCFKLFVDSIENRVESSNI